MSVTLHHLSFQEDLRVVATISPTLMAAGSLVASGAALAISAFGRLEAEAQAASSWPGKAPRPAFSRPTET